MKRVIRLLALVLGVTVLLSACGHNKNVEENAEETHPVLQVEGVTTLELYSDSVTLRIDRDENDLWVWHEDTSFPLDQEAAAELLTLPASLDGGEPVAEPEELSVYGLETPAKYVEVTADGVDVTYYVGQQAADGRWYVLTPENAVLLVEDEVVALLSRSIYDMAALPELPAIGEDHLLGVTLGDSQGTAVVLRTDENGRRLKGSRDVTEATAALAEELGTLTVTACVDYDPAEGAAAVCGLETPEAVVTVTYLASTGMEKTLTVTIGAATGDGGRYVTLDDDTTIYRMEEASLTETLAMAAAGL